jgi:hypothetical protein
MTGGLKVAVLVFSHTAALSVGAWCGVETAHRLAHFDALRRLETSQAFSRRQFAEAPPDEAREALKQNLDLLEDLGEANLSPGEFTIDKIRTLIRLSKTETALGHTPKADIYRAEAQHVCESAGWRDCSDEAMEHVIAPR